MVVFFPEEPTRWTVGLHSTRIRSITVGLYVVMRSKVKVRIIYTYIKNGPDFCHMCEILHIFYLT